MDLSSYNINISHLHNYHGDIKYLCYIYNEIIMTYYHIYIYITNYFVSNYSISILIRDRLNISIIIEYYRHMI